MQLVDRFLNETPRHPNPKLFYLWGHTYEFETNNNWEVIEEFASYIGGRENIFYATNGEILSYISAYRALVFDVDNRSVYNPTATDVYLHVNGKDAIAFAGRVVALV
jgi:hypothetical protein